MKSYLHVLVVLAINAEITDANFHYTQTIAKRHMDINNKNELQTHQGMDSRHVQKVNCSDENVFGEHSTQYKHCYR